MQIRTRRARSVVAAAAVLATVSAPLIARAQGPDTAGERRREPRVRDDRPLLAVGADLGFAHYGRTEGDEDFGFGPAWQARIGAQVVPWLSIDARYFGARHDGIGYLVAHAGSLEARLSIPLRVRPYLSGGVGWYTVTAYNEDGDALVAPDPAMQLPASLGVEVMLHERIGVQAEGTYRFLLDRNVPDAGFARTQLWGGTLGGRAYF